jgi:ADP-ribose pyrophosphatase YjhB (NUDIX family)
MPAGEQSRENTFQDVVTVFLTHHSKVLVLKRSSKVSTYKGHWAGVSGYLESEDPLNQAYTEMAEEVGLSRKDLTLLRVGKPLDIVDESRDRAWRVHPFLFAIDDPEKIRLDWEHIEFRWIRPEELAGLRTVPALKETLERVM